MPDETKPQNPTTTTSSTTPTNPIDELPREGGVVSRTSGGIAAPRTSGTSGGVILGTGEDVAGKMNKGAPIFGDVLRSIGFAVAESQKALDDGVITGVEKLNDTKIEVVTQVIQELDEDGQIDAEKSHLVTQELSVLNFFTPTFHEWKSVELCMDLTVGEFHAEQGVQFNAKQQSTSVGGGGSWGFGGWFNMSHQRSSDSVDIDNKQDVAWSSGQVRVTALLGPRRTGKFPTPATAEKGPQIYVTQGALAEQKNDDDEVTSRSVDVLIEVRTTAGGPMAEGKNIVLESGGLLPDFGTQGSVTDAKGRVKVNLKRNVGGAPGFAKFPLSVSFGKKRQAFTVML